VLAIKNARIGKPEQKTYHVTVYNYWKCDNAGFVMRAGDRGTPPPDMPGNVGVLIAVAYCALGGQGSTLTRLNS
jgi:hypothetical protein